jgi:iron complex transport system ATP-binding protein
MLEIDNLRFRHRNAGPDILRGVCLSIRPGGITTVLGPNGSGKTTLFKCLTGLWQPQSGSIRYGERDLLALSWQERAGIVAVVPQEHEPPFPYAVADVVLMGRAAHVSLFSSPSESDRSKADEAITAMGIDHLRERPYTRISGGERQLVLLARALAQETPVLVLDEPTSHLDFRNQILILGKVRELVRQRGLAVLMTVHDPNLAMQFSDHVVMISEGCVMGSGFPADVLTKENLMKMYGIDVTVIPHNGTRVIYPQVAP